MSSLGQIHQVNAGALSVGFHRLNSNRGTPVILLHGFPYDVHAYGQVAAILAEHGCDVVIPYLRGYGTTRFLADYTPRSGEQAVLGHDLLALMDALEIPSAVLAGYDWGGRAACVVSALWPQRVRGLLTCGGYNIQNIAAAMQPAPAQDEYRYWYQYYFHGKRGEQGLETNRRDLCQLLWRLWSPDWAFDNATFERSAMAFDNPDFVQVVVHSYRHRFGLVGGDSTVAEIEAALARQPSITAPTVVLDGATDGVMPSNGYGSSNDKFENLRQHRSLDRVGHNIPQEAPEAFAGAIIDHLL